MRKPCLFMSILMLFAFSTVLHAQEKIRVGIVQFEEKNNTGIDNAGVIVPEILTTRLKNIGRYNLTERILLKKTLEEQQLQMTGLTDTGTVGKVGKIYNLDAIVTGSIMKIGDTITISGRVIKTDTGEILESGTVKFKDIQNTEQVLEGLAYQLSGFSRDEYKRKKAASQIAKNRYGVRLGTGMVINDSEAGMTNAFSFLNVQIFYHSRWFDFEIIGNPPPSPVGNIIGIVNVNPFTHFGFGIAGSYLYDGILADDYDKENTFGIDGEYQGVMAGLNFRATDRLRASIYFGMVLHAEFDVSTETNEYQNYEVDNFIEFGAAAYLSIEYYINETFSVHFSFSNVGASAERVDGPGDDIWMGTSSITLAVGYSFQL